MLVAACSAKLAYSLHQYCSFMPSSVSKCLKRRAEYIQLMFCDIVVYSFNLFKLHSKSIQIFQFLSISRSIFHIIRIQLKLVLDIYTVINIVVSIFND